MATSGFHLLNLRFAVQAPIRRLPHFHGPHWSALFRNFFNTFDVKLKALNPLVWVQPIETGITAYEVGDRITLGLVVDLKSAPALELLLSRFNHTSVGQGHFQPGVTIKLESAVSRLTGRPWCAAEPPLSTALLEPEIDFLTRRETFTLETLSPLRIPRPAGAKKNAHRYCDEEFFLAGEHGDVVRRILDKVRGETALPATAAPDRLSVKGGALTWLDVAYSGKTMGGVVGVLEISGRPDREQARRLVLGQYLGVGKNAAFGLGFYRIPELDGVRALMPLDRSTSLFARATTVEVLTEALDCLPDSSPGPDGMRLADAKAAPLPFLEKQRLSILSGPPAAEIPMKQYRLPKNSGGERIIYVQNLGDRLVQRAFTEVLTTPVNNILSASSYAYRRGLSHKQAARALHLLLADGYCCGIKADISAFFDSVKIPDLAALLKGLFPQEPLIDYITAWLRIAGDQGVAGLPQGWSLSPVLSNLYLDRFDRAMAREHFRLVRFADDFVVLYRPELTTAEGTQVVKKSLARLGLVLKPEKTVIMVRGQAVTFLGYVVSADEIHPVSRPDEPRAQDWLPVFRPDWQRGLPVYLTSACRGAYSNGPHLVVKHDDESSDSLPWSRVSRLVVVGRSSFSGGVVYRAIREQVPITFIDIMGRTNGQFQPSGSEVADLSGALAAKSSNSQWSLSQARRLIAAKINNAFVLLRRNKIAAPELKSLGNKALIAQSVESLRGLEGAAARIYFNFFAQLTEPFEFKGRAYRPPDGPVNAMLSFGYTLLYNRLASVLRDKGFDPRKGIYHVGRGRHCALASDLLEPLRHLAERIVLSLIHLKEISPDNFYLQQGVDFNAWRMDGAGFRTYISRYEHTMASRFTPRHNQKMSYNAWLDETVDAFIRDVRYDIPYQPLRID